MATTVCYQGDIVAPVGPPAVFQFTVPASGTAKLVWSTTAPGVDFEIDDGFGGVLVAVRNRPAIGSISFSVIADAGGTSHTLKVSTNGTTATPPLTVNITIECPVTPTPSPTPTPHPVPTPTPHPVPVPVPTPHPVPTPVPGPAPTADNQNTILVVAAVGGGLLAAAFYAVSRRR